jgi:hypothetical protein
LADWHLYNQVTKEKRSNVAETSLIGWLQTLSPREQKQWLCWQTGYSGWLPLTEDEKLIPYLPVTSAQEEPPPMPEKTASVRPSEKRKVTAHEKAKENSAEQRRNPRVNTRLRAVLTNKKSSFISFTKNISLSGILLENEIPRHIFSGACEIYLTGPDLKESIKFQCVPVGSEDNPCRLQFSQVSDKYQTILENWLSDLKQGA